MRISATKVVQLVESEPPKLVILDETTLAEITLTPTEMDNLQQALHYFNPFMHQMFKLPGD